LPAGTTARVIAHRREHLLLSGEAGSERQRQVQRQAGSRTTGRGAAHVHRTLTVLQRSRRPQWHPCAPTAVRVVQQPNAVVAGAIVGHAAIHQRETAVDQGERPGNVGTAVGIGKLETEGLREPAPAVRRYSRHR